MCLPCWHEYIKVVHPLAKRFLRSGNFFGLKFLSVKSICSAIQMRVHTNMRKTIRGVVLIGFFSFCRRVINGLRSFSRFDTDMNSLNADNKNNHGWTLYVLVNARCLCVCAPRCVASLSTGMPTMICLEWKGHSIEPSKLSPRHQELTG